MASLIRRLSQSTTRRHSAPNNTGSVGSPGLGTVPAPVHPPSPNLQHLNPDELRVLGDVFCRLEQFEEVETARISQLRHELGRLDDHMRRETSRRGSIHHVDLRLCRLCFRNKFADGVGRSCSDCQRRVCNQCGSFTKLTWNKRIEKNVRGRWVCLFCQKKRELACASGRWFHGGRGQPTLTSSVFRRKVSDVGMMSDWGCSADVEQSDSSQPRHHSFGHKTDSEMGGAPREDGLRSARRVALRQRLPSGSTDETADMADDEDLDVDDEQFRLERQRCRQERLQMQHRKSRRRHKRLSVGTCTREDGILPDPPALCPKHGANYNYPSVAGELKQLTNTTAKNNSVQENGTNKHWRSSQESLKDKAMLHPRVRELTIPRKLSAPARTNLNEEQMLTMLNPANGPTGPGGPVIQRGMSCSSARYRSHSVPAQRIFKRSSSDGDKSEERNTKGKQLIEHAQVHMDSQSFDNIVISRNSKLIVEGNKNSSKSRRTNHMRLDSPSRTGKVQESLIPLRKPPPRTLYDKPHKLKTHHAVYSSTSPRQHTPDLLFPTMPSSSHRRSSAGDRVSRTSYSTSLENVHKASHHHRLQVPGAHSSSAVEVEVVSDTVLSGREGKRGSEESQDELLGRRTSDTPSVCTPDTDAGSTYSKRNCLRRSSSSYRFRIVLQRDTKDVSRRTMGYGMRVVGGKQGPDGKLGAFVTWVVRGGPADMGGITEGDQVLEWNGRSLVDATFEEVQQTVCGSGDTVQLIIMHTRVELEKRPSDCYKPPPHWRNQLTANQSRPSISESKDQSIDLGDSSLCPSMPSTSDFKDGLRPHNMDDAIHLLDGRPVGGRIQLKLYHDTRVNTLIVTLMHAQDLSPRPGPQKEMPSAFAKLQLNTNKEFSQVYKTESAKNSKNPEWMKMVEIADCDQVKISQTTLLVTVWDTMPRQSAVFIGEVLLDLRTADLQNTAAWYSLSEHDENTGRLPPPTPRLNKRFQNSFQSTDIAGIDERIDTHTDGTPTSPEETRVVKGKTRKMGKLKRRVSEVAMKVGAILVDKRVNAADKTLPSPESPSSLTVRRHSMVLLSNPATATRDTSATRKDSSRRLSGQFASILGKSMSRTNSQSSNTGGNTTTDIDDDNLDTGLNPAPEGGDIMSMLGPAQVPPKSRQETLVNGDIKLSFVITKGQLEVDVVCGKGLNLTGTNQAPDTYVKTYLVGAGKRLQRRKTKTVRSSTDPLYKHKLTYSASNVHGRYIQILVKEKAAGFDRNECLGEVVVKLDQLDLSSNTTGWYKLFREGAVQLGSCESLNW